MTHDTLTFDGAPVPFRPGQSLAAALTEAGYRAFRRTGRDAPRGMFCGMGVCQDCLVTVDGVPNRRACMTAAAAGQAVQTQAPFPALGADAAPQAAGPARVLEPDVAIVGGGAGGLAAAIAARAAGAGVVLVDERRVGGGQYYKQAADGSVLDTQQAEGAALLAEARASGADIVGGVDLWGAFDGPLLLGDVGGTALVVRPRTLIIATGAYERPVMVPGWTLPGVMTTGAAQTLWRSYGTLPGARVAFVGSGPLNLQVALELARGGATIAALAEAAPEAWRRPLSAARMALADPTLAARGVAMLRAAQRHGVRVSHATRATRIEQGVGGLILHMEGPDGAHAIEADAICMNQGFEPQNEILRLLGAAMRYDPAVGHLRCQRDAACRTGVPGVFAVGDCAGLGGAPAARVEGRLAGRAAAAAATGHGDAYDSFADNRELARHRRFQRQLWRLYDIAPRPARDIAPETVLCRCEEITLAEAVDGHYRNPGHVGTLKRGTRVGMGRCQGRYCGPVAARLVAESTGAALDDRSFFAPRVPVKPVTIASILAAQEALDGAE